MDESKSSDLYVPEEYNGSIFQKYKYGRKKKGVHTCAVTKCVVVAENFANTSLHSFPKNATLREEWAERCSLSATNVSNLFICSDHFVQSDFHRGKADNYTKGKEKRRLFTWAIPSKNLPKHQNEESFDLNPNSPVLPEDENSNCWEIEALDEKIDVDWPDTSILTQRQNEESIDLNRNSSVLPEDENSNFWEIEALDEKIDISWPDTSILTQHQKEELVDFNPNSTVLQQKPMSDNSVQTEYVSHDKCVQVNTIHDFMPKFSVLEIMTSDALLNAWTGVPTFRLLHAIEDCIIVAFPETLLRYKLTLLERIVLCFMKLKTNMTFVCMASLFGVDDGSISRNFATMLGLLAQTMRPVVYFPSTDEIAANMPRAFVKYKYTSTRAILDCSEVKIQLPKCLNCRIASYSQYKKGHTIKYLITITPAGLISHISEAYSGKSSDKFIFNSDDLIEKFDSFTDAIMMDKGVLIENELLQRGVQMVRPSFFRSHINQFPEQEIVCNTQIARLRVHVERAIQRMKIFSILKDQIEHNILPYVNDILIVTAAIANLTKPILSEDKF